MPSALEYRPGGLYCLVCPESRLKQCSKYHHPAQQVMRQVWVDRALILDPFLYIIAYLRFPPRFDIYSCPVCAIDELSIYALYQHFLLQHHLQSSEERRKFRCPVCVCFRRKDYKQYIDDDLGFVGHLLLRHSFPGHQYVTNVAHNENLGVDRKLMKVFRFSTCYLPPNIFGLCSNVDTPLSTAMNDLTLRGENAEQHDCPICFEKIDDNSRRLLPCSHQFHTECIDRWLEQSRQCPI
ncbi:uncharacterized protein LOC126581151 isoform X1 [Anopheles aquasalis]|uniref:uncharacterized protein LOC126581151 isoform X1 n=1 Tax=Anopheles aquasalis TaxID=42839 RepID=UPI00215B2333|nr:uncharacterized protein LOC126581151 isoform X1 [Anopheles aquasalis]